MTLYLDPRGGSGHLLPLLRHAEHRMLKFGDAEFVGVGPEGAPTYVGIEIKRVSDLLSCIMDDRYAGYQLPGMLERYDVCYFLVLGEYRPGPGGRLEIPYNWGHWGPPKKDGRTIMYSTVDNWLSTLSEKVGVQHKHARGDYEAAHILMNWYGWWKDGYDEHQSHLAIYSGPRRGSPTVRLGQSKFKHRIAKEIPGIGYHRAQAVAAVLPTWVAMAEAGPKEWAAIPGVGKVLADRVYKTLRDPEAR